MKLAGFFREFGVHRLVMNFDYDDGTYMEPLFISRITDGSLYTDVLNGAFSDWIYSN